MARQGKAWRGAARRGEAWQREAGIFLGWSYAEFDSPREDCGWARWGEAGHGPAGQG
jgi:hypothetical protein